MKDLDILEINILKAIENSSVFNIKEIRMVYERCLSFDKTVSILKKAISHEMSIEQAIIDSGF